MAGVEGEVVAEIRRILGEELEWKGAVEPAHDLLKDLQLDSLGLTVLAVGLENRFRVKLSEEDSVGMHGGGPGAAGLQRVAATPGERAMKGPALPPVKYATVTEMLAATARTALGLTFVDAAESGDGPAVGGGPPARPAHRRRGCAGWACAWGTGWRILLPTVAGLHGRVLRHAAGRRGAGAALSAGAAGPAGRVPPRHGAHAGA